jgi:hypothetical protein
MSKNSISGEIKKVSDLFEDYEKSPISNKISGFWFTKTSSTLSLISQEWKLKTEWLSDEVFESSHCPF